MGAKWITRKVLWGRGSLGICPVLGISGTTRDFSTNGKIAFQ